MKYQTICSVLFVSLLFCQCKKDSYPQDFISVNNNPQYSWKEVLPFGSGAFPEEWTEGKWPKGLFPVIAFDGDLWMTWQRSSWSSSDGLNWEQYNKNDWGQRIYTSYYFFLDKLWMSGGLDYQPKTFLNDVWTSADGKIWTQETAHAEWQPRGSQTIIVFKNKLFLFGGATEVLPDRTTSKFMNDIWTSDDGIHWNREETDAPWPACDYPRMLIFKDSLYMVGGQGHAGIWRSADGKSWLNIKEEAEWKKRYDYGALVFDNKIWVYGGRDISTNHTTGAKDDVWYSEDGNTWLQQFEHAPWTVRSAMHSIVFKNKLWIFSGKHTGRQYNWGGDIWTLNKN
jgi:hypothetical protein